MRGKLIAGLSTIRAENPCAPVDGKFRYDVRYIPLVLTTTVVLEIENGYPGKLIDRWILGQMLPYLTAEPGGELGHPI